MLKSRLVIGTLCCSTLLGLPLCRAPVQAANSPGTAAERQHAFTDVPKGSSLYDAAMGLDQAGFWSSYPGGFFSRKRGITRIEFAVATQRMCYAANLAVEKVEKGLTLALPWEATRPLSHESAPDGQPRGMMLQATFQNAEKLRRAFTQLQTLATEFDPELKLLGTDPEQLRKETAAWLQKAGKLSAQARALKAPQASRKVQKEMK